MSRRFTYRYPHGGRAPGRVAILAGIVMLLPATLGALATLFSLLPADPARFSAGPNQLPSALHLLGTDALGRDLLSRLASASARFLGPGLLAAAVALSVGGALGVARGLGGVRAGAVASWAIQVLDAVPKLVLVLLVAAISGSSLGWIMVTVGLTFAPQIAEAVRSSVERLRASAFIEAERSLGASMGRIVFVHILWGHSRQLLLAQLTSLLAYALLVETSLSYLGGELGVQEPAASWGNMLALARDAFFRGHYLPSLAPALMIALTLLGFSSLATGVLRSLESGQ